jgi:hypothetical protein
MGRPSKWSPEFREEAVRMYRESDESIAAVARRLGLGAETFRRWVRGDEVERGLRDGRTREEHAEIVNSVLDVTRQGYWAWIGMPGDVHQRRCTGGDERWERVHTETLDVDWRLWGANIRVAPASR